MIVVDQHLIPTMDEEGLDAFWYKNPYGFHVTAYSLHQWNKPKWLRYLNTRESHHLAKGSIGDKAFTAAAADALQLYAMRNHIIDCAIDSCCACGKRRTPRHPILKEYPVKLINDHGCTLRLHPDCIAIWADLNLLRAYSALSAMELAMPPLSELS